jgi:nitroreductase
MGVLNNPVLQAMLQRRSIRAYTEQMPPDEVIATVVRAGQQAPFAYQLCSVLLSCEREVHPFAAPLLFTICVDAHRLEQVMARRNWQMVTNDLSLLFFGIQDAALLAENMVIAAESLGLGSCFLGSAPYRAEEIAEQYNLPLRVFPLVQLAMGYPAEDPPVRPRYPLEFILFKDTYPELTDDMVERAMQAMDEGYLAQDYYRNAGYKIPLEDGRSETFTFEDYGWTEHISRKAGQWLSSLDDLIEPLESRGFRVTPDS